MDKSLKGCLRNGEVGGRCGCQVGRVPTGQGLETKGRIFLKNSFTEESFTYCKIQLFISVQFSNVQ